MHWNKLVSDEKNKLENVKLANGQTIKTEVSEGKVLQLIKDKYIHKKEDRLIKWMKRKEKEKENGKK